MKLSKRIVMAVLILAAVTFFSPQIEVYPATETVTTNQVESITSHENDDSPSTDNSIGSPEYEDTDSVQEEEHNRSKGH